MNKLFVVLCNDDRYPGPLDRYEEGVISVKVFLAAFDSEEKAKKYIRESSFQRLYKDIYGTMPIPDQRITVEEDETRFNNDLEYNDLGLPDYSSFEIKPFVRYFKYDNEECGYRYTHYVDFYILETTVR